MDSEELLSFVKSIDFFDQSIYDLTLSNGNPPTAKEIGTGLGLSEQSVSRTYKVFVSLL